MQIWCRFFSNIYCPIEQSESSYEFLIHADILLWPHLFYRGYEFSHHGGHYFEGCHDGGCHSLTDFDVCLVLLIPFPPLIDSRYSTS